MVSFSGLCMYIKAAFYVLNNRKIFCIILGMVCNKCWWKMLNCGNHWRYYDGNAFIVKVVNTLQNEKCNSPLARLNCFPTWELCDPSPHNHI